MDRRAFIAGGSALLAGPLASHAQQPAKVARIGYLTSGSPPVTRAIPDDDGNAPGLSAFRKGLRECGYVEGQNILIEYRAAEKFDRLPGLATELALKVDVILAVATPAARAAQQATTTIPIVGVAMGDPVQDGLVASLARPGGNITGSSFLGPELVPKRMELLKETLPRVSRAAVLWQPGAFGQRTMKDMMNQTEAAARTLGLQLQFVEAQGPDEFDRAFSAMTRAHAEALFVFPSPMLFSERKRIVALAEKHRLPAMFVAREFVALGGLIAYGASITDLSRRAATSVDRILKGAKPADLPVEQPTAFELVINLKTAKALGLTIPQPMLQRADAVIQ